MVKVVDAVVAVEANSHILAFDFLLGFCVAVVSLYFQVCMRKGMILRPYRYLLGFVLYKVRHSDYYYSALYLFKPLGLCWVCNTYWIALILNVYFTGSFDFIHTLIVTGNAYVFQKVYYRDFN